ncbi:hypothetical protein CCACVL1_22355 [Corchorus capsularis]|uniref:non-specific serine/threonine protein kinase n=1 Tax=Corchorus capsularis TaxID=210143 RepID=A0A1R3H008_COCAP|nr:hypothetical protein CCACVL1_22355 [Corchorus capsularis]
MRSCSFLFRAIKVSAFQSLPTLTLASPSSAAFCLYPKPSTCKILSRRHHSTTFHNPLKPSLTSSTASGVVGFSKMASAAGEEDGQFKLSETSLLKINKGDITKWFVDGSSDAIFLAIGGFWFVYSMVKIEHKDCSNDNLLQVNPANQKMLGGGGADGAIHRAAGLELRDACYEVPEVQPGIRCPTGEARITPGFKLPASHVIHTVGPIYDYDEDPRASLRNAYKNSLTVAKENNIQYIAFPAISCGVYGYPFEEAATVAISTVKEFANDIKEGCRSDLSDLNACDACFRSVGEVLSKLVSLDGNVTDDTDCLNFVVLYATGIVNEFGPETDGCVECAFGLNLNEQSRSKGSVHLLWLRILIPATMIILIGGFSYLVYRILKNRIKPMDDNELEIVQEIQRSSSAPQKFRLKELKAATDSMLLTNLDFIAEVTVIGNLHHKNLVKLIGWCYESNELLLVYEFMPSGSLDRFIFRNTVPNNAADHNATLNWETRHNIICGVARALDYLHNGCEKRVIHRDIKASNIMLDSEFNARLGDFGLARTIQMKEKTHHSTKEIAGTPGYMAIGIAPGLDS